MAKGHLNRRRLMDKIMTVLLVAAVIAALTPLLSTLWWVARQGLPALSFEFLTTLPKPLGEPGGGIVNGILGSLMLIGIAAAFGVPMGVLTGIYLAESGSRAAIAVRFLADVAAGIPSIVIGIAVYALVVLSMGYFSALAGGIALGIIMIPGVARTTEEMLRLVPHTVREGALALGVPRWVATMRVVVPTAAPGIVTGVMLAIARVAGETAPLLFTSPGSPFLSLRWDEPIASLPVQIFTFAIQPYKAAHEKAWGAALVLILLILVLNGGARLLVRYRSAGR